jgi:hypothetical protein
MIEASQRMITINSQGEELGGINPEYHTMPFTGAN